jgi:hypothetical protein
MNRLIASIGFLMGLSACGLAGKSSQSALQDSLRIDWDLPNVDVGKGVDAVSEEVRGQCVEFNSEDMKGSVDSGEQRVVSFIGVLKSRKDIEERLALRPAETMRSGDRAMMPGEKRRFVDATVMSDYAVFMAVHTQVLVGTRSFANGRLSEYANHILSVGSPAWFVAACGDEYVSRVAMGGERLSLLGFRATNPTERHEIEAAIESLSVVGEELTEAQKRTVDWLTQRQIMAKGFQIGGGPTPVSSNLSLKNAIFGARAFEKSLAHDASLVSSLFGVTESYSSLDSRFVARDVSAQQVAVQKMDALRLQLVGVRDNIGYVLANPFQFEDFDAAALKNSRDEVDGKLHALHNIARRCMADRDSCDFSGMEIPVVSLPKERG